MTELIAYRYKQRTADEMHTTRWTPWRSGRSREEMMAELRPIGNKLVIVQCCVPRAEINPIDMRENDLWVWLKNTGWKKTNGRNWFVDNCDPTHNYDTNDDEDPFGAGRVLTDEERKAIRRQIYGTPEDLTVAIMLDEMDDDPPNRTTGRPAEDFPSINGGDIPNEGYVKNKFVDTVEFSAEGKIG